MADFQEVKNTLLLALPRDLLQTLERHLERVDLPEGLTINEARQVADFTYFPNSGVVSLLIDGAQGKPVEVGLFGREGCGPINAITATPTLPFRATVQVAGDGYRIANPYLAAAVLDDKTGHRLFIRYAQTLATQLAYTVYATANFSIDQRLARWLLMCRDRTDSNEIVTTHEFLSYMLSARRQSVTGSLHMLEYWALIDAQRGLVIIKNRRGLEELAGDSYGAPEREYASLISPVHFGAVEQQLS